MTDTPARSGGVLIGVLLIAMNMRAPFNAVGPLLPQVTTDQGLSGGAAGALGAIPLLAFALFSPLAASIGRRLGSERTILMALGILAAGILLRSLVPAFGGIWIGTVLIGMGIALVNVLLPGIVKKNFPTRVSSVTGLYAAVQSVFAAAFAGVVVPIAGADPSGWRFALGISAGFVIIGMVVGVPLLRSPRTITAETVSAPQHASVVSPWNRALGWQVALFFGTQSMAFYALVTWLPTIEQANGLTPAAAGTHLTLLMLVGVAANLLTPIAMKRAGPSQSSLAVLSATMMLVTWAGYLFLPSWGIAWAIFGGLAGGSGLVILLSLFSLRTQGPATATALSGMGQSIGYLLAALGPLLAGLIHDLTDGWHAPILFILATTILQAIFGYLAGRPCYLENTTPNRKSKNPIP
ncbi:MFS transporter [Plantibacter sp. RU18]|uniref:MFS transporter n=1 Tax=Plantibacter sp. RU18 TaxID=3158143 RepID=UPI003D3606A3